MSARRAIIDRARWVLHALGVFRRLHRLRLPDTVSVVMYHGLVRSPLPVTDWCFVPVERFTGQMEYLARHFHVMHIEEAFDPGRPRVDRPVACITFDDGFASVLELALPVLDRLSIPATVYLVTDLVDTEDTVWFARLHRAVCESRAPEVRLRGLSFALTSPEARADTSASLQRALKALPPSAFETALTDALDQLGGPAPRPTTTWDAFRMLRSDEIRRMSQRGLVRFGGHSASHQILTRTTPDDARHEIHASVGRISALVAGPSRTFAYPNGGPDDFDERVVEAVREAGIQYAVTTIEGPNGRTTDPYRIRRYGIGANDSLARFAELVHHARDTIGPLLGAPRHP